MTVDLDEGQARAEGAGRSRELRDRPGAGRARTLVSGGYDGRLIWWDLESGAQGPRRRRASQVDSPRGRDARRLRRGERGRRHGLPALGGRHRAAGARAPRPRRADPASTSPRCSSPCAISPDGRLTRDRRQGRAHQRLGDRVRQPSRRAGRAGLLHLGPGPAAALDRRHPRAGLLARRDPARRRRDRQDRQHRPPRQQAPDRGLRLAEGPAARRGPGRGPRHGRAAGIPPRGRLAARAPAATPTASCSSATPPARRSSRRPRPRCTSTTSRSTRAAASSTPSATTSSPSCSSAGDESTAP